LEIEHHLWAQKHTVKQVPPHELTVGVVFYGRPEKFQDIPAQRLVMLGHQHSTVLQIECIAQFHVPFSRLAMRNIIPPYRDPFIPLNGVSENVPLPSRPQLFHRGQLQTTRGSIRGRYEPVLINQMLANLDTVARLPVFVAKMLGKFERMNSPKP